MECDEVRAVVAEYLAHQLPDHVVADIEAHLCVCEQCRLFLGEALDRQDASPRSRAPEVPVEQASAADTVPFFTYGVIAVAVVVVMFIVILFIKSQKVSGL